MSDFGETPKPQRQELKNTFSFSEAVKASSVTEEAYSTAWGMGITGRRIDFPRKDKTLSWAVEVTIPLEFNDVKSIYENLVTQMEKERGFKISESFKAKKLESKIGKRYYNGPEGIKLPEKIRTIKIVTLSPQEALPKEQRNIISDRPDSQKHPLRDVVRGGGDRNIADKIVPVLFKQNLDATTRIKALNDLFKDAFGVQSKEQANQFLTEINKSNGDEILFIHAHSHMYESGEDDYIGEQSDQLTRDFGKQSLANSVKIDEILNEYNNPDKTAAILLLSCYTGKSDIRPVKDIPVFSVKGLSGTNRGFTGQLFPSKTSVSLPNKA